MVWETPTPIALSDRRGSDSTGPARAPRRPRLHLQLGVERVDARLAPGAPGDVDLPALHGQGGVPRERFGHRLLERQIHGVLSGNRPGDQQRESQPGSRTMPRAPADRSHEPFPRKWVRWTCPDTRTGAVSRRHEKQREAGGTG